MEIHTIPLFPSWLFGMFSTLSINLPKIIHFTIFHFMFQDLQRARKKIYLTHRLFKCPRELSTRRVWKFLIFSLSFSFVAHFGFVFHLVE